MYFLLKRFKGGIHYSEFYEMWDDDMWVLYNLETELVEKEIKDSPGNGNKGNVPEPTVADEGDEAVRLMREIRGE